MVLVVHRNDEYAKKEVLYSSRKECFSKDMYSHAIPIFVLLVTFLTSIIWNGLLVKVYIKDTTRYLVSFSESSNHFCLLNIMALHTILNFTTTPWSEED